MTAEEFAAMERRARMFEAANEKMLADNKRLREENARLRELLDDVFAQWDGDWPEELVARVKAAISGERAIGGPLATSSRRRS